MLSLQNLRNGLLIILISMSLSGCVGAFVAGAAAGGAIIYDRRSSDVIIEDQKIVYTADSAIAGDAALRTRVHVEFSSFNRIVLVTGQAEDEQSREQVMAKVRTIPHIRRLYNEIAILPPNSLGQRSQDAWITTKIKSVMLATAGLHSSQIKVVTEDGSVYLMGLVTPHQGELAIDIARHVRGVKRVVKLFEYEH